MLKTSHVLDYISTRSAADHAMSISVHPPLSLTIRYGRLEVQNISRAGRRLLEAQSTKAQNDPTPNPNKSPHRSSELSSKHLARPGRP